MKAHRKTAEQVLRELAVERSQGLSELEVQASRSKHGENAFTREKPLSFFQHVKEAASEPMLMLLVFAACITCGVNIVQYFTGGEADFLECVGIIIAIALSVAITVVMEGRSAKAFEALNKINEDMLVKVLRSGKIQLLPQNQLVVGDLVYVEAGDKLVADGRLLEAASLRADESSLTGESMAVAKDAVLVCPVEKTPVAERRNMLYSGCFITEGSGLMIVTAVGNSTQFGQIAKELSRTGKASTPLQEKLGRLGKMITIIGSSAALLVFIIQAIQFTLNGTATLDNILQAFVTSIILIVAVVPEGLPTIVAVSLSFNIIKMSKQNALVKKMIACETIGCINVICSDKTGTLTQNRMTVTDIYVDGSIFPPQNLDNQYLIKNFCLNSSADLDLRESKETFIGNPTECALLAAVQKSGSDYNGFRSSSKIEHVYPFSSESKNMTTVEKQNNIYTVYTKGSPEKILSMCTLTDGEREQAQAAMSGFQEKAGRVIAFAHKESHAAYDYEQDKEIIENGLVFDGFVAISDPLHEDVFEAVKRCQSAGISLKMLTGDNIVTAKAIASQLQMLGTGCLALEASEIESMTDDELQQKLPEIAVIARSTPVVKMRVVNALKMSGNIVAVTGDGINDAPAIKNADVGIAMGITGTDVSKEASDIVLLDDSFATIVKAVQWGRGIYENFQRFIQFQLTVNLSSLIVVLASVLAGLPSPFTALQLLWLNIVMDGPPALTLGLEPIRKDLLQHSPTPRDANILTKGMLVRIALNGIFIAVIFMAQQSYNFLGATPEQAGSVLFTLFVLFQLFNAFNSRELTNGSIFAHLAGNRLMLGVFFITFCLQVLITQFGGALYGTVALPLTMWLKIIATAVAVIAASELCKLLQRNWQKKSVPEILPARAKLTDN